LICLHRIKGKKMTAKFQNGVTLTTPIVNRIQKRVFSGFSTISLPFHFACGKKRLHRPCRPKPRYNVSLPPPKIGKNLQHWNELRMLSSSTYSNNSNINTIEKKATPSPKRVWKALPDANDTKYQIWKNALDETDLSSMRDALDHLGVQIRNDREVG